MFGIIAFIIILTLLSGYWPIFLVGLILIIVIFAGALIRSSKKPDNYELSETANYKIGAEVSSYFYDEVKQYCHKHHISISELIRKSVRDYMDANR